MKIKDIEHLDLKCYSKVLDNGLTVYVVPKNDVNNIYVTFTTKYGSYQNDFIPNGKKDMITVPTGVAHFLEHKLFATEDGIDPFTFFGKSGTSSNASTSTFKTTYLFEGKNNFIENLNYLLDFVETPYFTDSNVEEEKGIIIQEIKMYQDNPYRVGYEKSMYNTFLENPVRYSVGGSTLTVSKITKEDLYTCYNTFYNPANMVLVVTGSVDPKVVIDTVENNQSKKKFEKFNEIVLKKYDEPDSVYKEKEIVKMNVTIPKVFVNYKIKFPKIASLTERDIISYINLYLDSCLGYTSDFNEEMIDKQIVLDGVESSVMNARTHMHVMIDCETKKIDEALKLLDFEINKKFISESVFNRKKKVMLASTIFASDNIFSINSKLVNDFVNVGDVEYDVYSRINNMTYETMLKILDKIDFNSKAIVIVEPKNID